MARAQAEPPANLSADELKLWGSGPKTLKAAVQKLEDLQVRRFAARKGESTSHLSVSVALEVAVESRATGKG